MTSGVSRVRYSKVIGPRLPEKAEAGVLRHWVILLES